MKKEQKIKLLSIIKNTLIPAIIEVQVTELYPVKYNFAISDSWHIKIQTNQIILFEKEGDNARVLRAMRATMAGEGYIIPTLSEPLELDVQKIEEWKFRPYGENNLINLPDLLIKLGESMKEYLQEAEKYQKKINSIFKFSENLSLPSSRNVLIEKSRANA